MKESLLLQKTQDYNHISESYSRSRVRSFSKAENATVFLSHNHNDRELVLRIKYLLEELDAKVYIDWLDSEMPEFTNATTAKELKKKINTCDKFILIASNAAIESKWCNWELGQGDALKYESKKLALFPVEPDNSEWKGTEYLKIYPTIVYRNGKTKCSNGSIIDEGYYFQISKNGKLFLTPLVKWLYK